MCPRKTPPDTGDVLVLCPFFFLVIFLALFSFYTPLMRRLQSSTTKAVLMKH
jgi:hypothetical protein